MQQKRHLIFIIAGCLLVPVVISQIIRLPLGSLTIGDENAWIGFLGSYVGGIIGGLVAFYVARYQIDRHFERQIANEEMLRYINQMPSLVKIKYELEKMTTSLKSALEQFDEYKRHTENGREEYFNIKVYNIREESWASLDSIEDPNFNAGLLTIKYSYLDIQEILEYDVHLSQSIKDKLVLGGYVTSTDFEKMHQAYLLDKEIIKATTNKKELLTGNTIPELIYGISDTLEIIDIMLASIEQEKEKRQEIRDK